MADRMNRPKQVDLNFVASELQLEPSLVGRRRRKKKIGSDTLVFSMRK
jgi:hypothetical protein